ncbi:MAG: phage terminase large subunit [Gemmatimonadales bacterium]|nr:phage terminase large subunit [Gemmatimonadales bacterium]
MTANPPIKLTADLIESFAGVYLSGRYDSPQPTPDFHRECWARYCGDHPACATAAPRNHAKSTALTHDFILATVLFRVESYVILVGSSEDMAIEHLGDIANELRENEELIAAFKIKEFEVDQKTDIIIECLDGYKFRIIARGAEQKIRGRKWQGRRPGLIVFDDIEDDEQVENRDRRVKFRRWFFRACKQALRDGGKIRGHGTILHEDSLLSRLMKNKEWNSKLYKAHAGYDDFSDILWPEKFPEARLRAIRTEFEAEGDGPGYSQEYLNDPLDNTDAYLRKDDFLPMREGDFDVPKEIAIGCDFAVSKADKANRTSFTIGGQDAANVLHIIDQRVDRWSTDEWMDEMFILEQRYHPKVWYVEDGVIWKAVAPTLFREMTVRGIWLSIEALLPVKDKATRGRPLQKRHRAGAVRFDKQASWYPAYEYELLRFTGHGEAAMDDQFDSTATLVLGLDRAPITEERDFMSKEEEDFESESTRLRGNEGRSSVTGY